MEHKQPIKLYNIILTESVTILPATRGANMATNPPAQFVNETSRPA